LSGDPAEISRIFKNGFLVNLILQAFEKTSTPFCPPKPKELEIAAPIFTARA